VSSAPRGIFSMLRDIPIKALLVLGFLLAGLLPVMVGALVSFEVGRTQLKKQAFHQLEAVRAIKRAQIERFFDERIRDVRTLVDDPSLRQAFVELHAAYHDLEQSQKQELQGLDKGRYIAPESYKKVSARHIAFLRQYIRLQGYYDLLMLDREGVAFFSVEKEVDFGRAHARDASALGDAWHAVHAGKETFLTDMKLYAPSKNAPAQFVAAPLTGDNGQWGVLVLQISLDSINAIMGERSGMGTSGETYLVGKDGRMRSDSVLVPETHSVAASFGGTVLENGVRSRAVTGALAGHRDAGVITGYRGQRVLSAWAPLAVGEARWAFVAEISEHEIDRRIDKALSGTYLFILVISAAAVLILAFLVSALIARHLHSLSKHFAELTEEALAGKLTTRGDPALVGPDFKALLGRTNDLIDAFASRLDDLPVPVLMLDCDYRICFLNSAAAALGGKERAALSGQRCCDTFRCACCDTGAGCPGALAMSGGHTVQGETVLTTANREIPVSYTSSPVLHPDGRLLGAWQIFVDQSVAQRMMMEKRRLENQLYRAQRLDALGTLSSGIAHDFNNILSYMLVYADLIDQDIDDNSFAQQNLNHITTAIERAAELVRHMLVFSRNMDGQRITFDVVPVVRETLELFSASLPGSISVDLSGDIQALHFEGDPTHIRQVVMNLCSNARDAMDETEGTIGLHLSDIDPEQDRGDAFQLPDGLVPQEYLCLRVLDTGCGMDARTREHLFEPFYTTKSPGKGTGLGLAVVHGIVTSYGGTLTVDSAVGQGTTITVYLPRMLPET